MQNSATPHVHIRFASADDQEILWQMLYHAAHMHKDGIHDYRAAQHDPYLLKYVADWGKPSDLGVIGLINHQPVGAVWSRLLIGEWRTNGYVDDHTPELAAAVVPEWVGCGIGSQLLRFFLQEAGRHFPAICLNVRDDNPAVRLYQRLGFEITGDIVNRIGGRSLNMLWRAEKRSSLDIPQT